MHIPQERTELRQLLLKLPDPQFDAVIFDLKPPPGNVPPRDAVPSKRVDALFEWLESPIGPGLEALRTALEKEFNRTGTSESSGYADGIAEPLLKPLKELKDRSKPHRKRQFHVRLRHVLPLVALSSGLAMASLVSIARLLRAFEWLEMMAYDHVLTARPPESLSDRIIVLEANQAVVDTERVKGPEGFTLTLTDDTLTAALDQLQQYSAGVIGIDWYLPAAPERWTESTLQAFQSSGTLDQSTIYGVCFQPYAGREGEQIAVPAPNPQAIPPEHVGFSNFASDDDNVLRRHLVSNGLGDAVAAPPCPSTVAFSALIALRYLELNHPELTPLNYPELPTHKHERRNHLPLGATTLVGISPFTLTYGGYQNLVPGAFELMLNYREPPGNDLRAAFPHKSLYDLLEGRLEPSSFQGKIVLLGLTAEGVATDEFLTPYGRQPGVTLQAHMVDHLLSVALGERRQIWVWTQAGEFAWIVVWGLLGGLLGHVGRDRPQWLAGSWVGGLFAIYLAGRLAMGVVALWLPMVPPMVAFTLAHGVVVYTGGRLQANDSDGPSSDDLGEH